MIRVKTFDATGVAPGGRLFAGDINAIQDAAAALTDLTQNVSVATLAIGEAGLQLLRFGTGEARLVGALRVDGILRGLSGIYAGQYTTTQRDAIALGSRPTGLVIYNSTTGKLEYNTGTDTTPAWTGLSAIITAQAGAPPGATAANANQFYLRTDLNGGTLYYSNGAAWVQMAHGVTIANGEVTDAMLAGSITPSKITGTAVITSDARLSDQRVPTANSVDSSKIIDRSIAAIDIGVGVITTTEIADGTITGTDINSGSALSVASMAATGAISAASLTTTGSIAGGSAVYSGSGGNQLITHRSPYGTYRHFCVGTAAMPADTGGGQSVSASFDRAFSGTPYVAPAPTQSTVNQVGITPSTTGVTFNCGGQGAFTVYYIAEGAS